MTPISFATSFGWYHEADGDCGIVLCPAQGHEDLCTHKALRLLADAFAAHGYPTLRFDYAGTGDSLGDDLEPGRLEAWIGSIESAVAWLRTHTQADKIVLVGLRLGSALAALAAERLGSVDGLVLLAPVVSGRAYMRELSTLSNFIRKPENAEGETKPETIEIAGFVFTPDTVKDISAIDLPAFKKPPAPHVLLIAIETQASADKLAKSWSGLGASVERQVFTHYAELLIDPAFSQLPAEVLRNCVHWLVRHFPRHPAAAPSRAARECAPYKPHEQDAYSEYPVFFGAAQNLFGMMCLPKGIAYERPAIVYLNAGANHHIGWGRSTVEVCRKLARMGLASLRIDIAAIGDSAEPDGGVEQILYRDESTKDVSAAIDWLASQGFHNITVIGLCAGAHLSFHAALADERISRIIMVNLQKFLWHKGDSLIVAYREAYQSTGFYLRRLFVADTWLRLLSGKIKARGILTTVSSRLRKRAQAAVVSALARAGRQTSGDIPLVKDWMKRLDARKVSQCFIFSIGDAGLDELSLYRRIRGGQVRSAPCVSLAFIENADHNLSQHASRDRLMDILQRILCTEKAQKPVHSVLAAPGSLVLPAPHLER